MPQNDQQEEKSKNTGLGGPKQGESAPNGEFTKAGDEKSAKTRFMRGPFIWIALAIVLVSLGFLLFGGGGFNRIDTKQGLDLLRDGKVEQVKVIDNDRRVDMVLTEDFQVDERNYGKRVQFFYVEPRGDEVITAINDAKLQQGYTDEVPKNSWISTLLLNLIPFIIIVLVFWFLLSQMSGGARGIMNFGKSKAKLIQKEHPDVTFKDVAGVDEALEELQEIKEFLAEPAKFTSLGAKIPKGVMLYGPPGTGKTLLARAIAGEAKVPFFSISGSDFVEMYVGVGASRVRDLFEQAKNNSPCIIFIDEIDAVGRQRGVGMGGGNDEREQTLNQLLVEMDGFDATTNVILIAATNRPDVLDPALLRPGRFDRQVNVEAPDMKGRKHILEVHARNKPLAPDVDLSIIAKRTPGFSGADLANVLNEAALLTARSGRTQIDNRILDEAIDRVIAGPQKRTRLMNDKERLVTAYHEGGHALVAAAMNNTDPVTKITILPRGRALGYTMVLPDEDKYSTTRNELLDQLAYAMGGRVAEEIVFHDPTTGAANDIEKATQTARKMVTQYGMSEALGMVKLGDVSTDPFAQRASGSDAPGSDDTQHHVDIEVRKLIDAAHADAYAALNDNRGILDRLAHELLEKETLDQRDLEDIFAGVRKAPQRKEWLVSPDRPGSNIPPIEVPERITSAEPEIWETPVQTPDPNSAAENDGGAGDTAGVLPPSHPETGTSQPPAPYSSGQPQTGQTHSEQNEAPQEGQPQQPRGGDESSDDDEHGQGSTGHQGSHH